VLILGVASVQMDAILHLKEMGHETFAIAMAKDGPGADVADHFAIINVLDEPAVVQYAKQNGINLIYSVGSDLAMPVACKLSDRLGLPFFVDYKDAYICNHKDLLRNALTPDCPWNIPFQVMEKCGPVNITFPCIMKPSDSQGQRGIFLVNNQEEVNEHFEDAKKYSRDHKVIVEHYVVGNEYSVNCYFVNGEMPFMVASDRETWPQYTGLIHKHIVPTRTLNAEVVNEIKEMMLDVCKRVGVANGPMYAQIKVENNHPYIIEMTPRLDGCHMWNILARATGVDLLKLCFEHLLSNDTSELKKMREKIDDYELVFFCQEPNTIMDRSKLIVPDDAEYNFYYYETGDTIRPVNGKYDKIGYYIHRK
jgi:carbamoylphosphate synthase large subunit